MRFEFSRSLKQFGQNQSGATAIEYAMIASLISIVIVGALLMINGSMVNMYELIRSHVQGAIDGTGNG